MRCVEKSLVPSAKVFRQKKTKFLVVQIKEPIFCFTLNFVIGAKCDKDLTKFVHEQYGKFENWEDNKWDGVSYGPLEGTQSQFVLCMSEYDDGPVSRNRLQHELFHAVSTILSDRGVRDKSKEGAETTAYMIGWLTQVFTEEWTRWDKRYNRKK